MAQGLSPSDRALWKATTLDVTPLGASLGPAEGHVVVKVSAPRSVPYNPRVDLHGVTVHEAFGVVMDHVSQGAMLGYKKLTIITGRSGQINQELPRWMEKNPHVRSVVSMNGGGAWEVQMKKGT
jgi:DNA-nicking Smr family endonuclease